MNANKNPTPCRPQPFQAGESPLFNLGRTVATPAALAALERLGVGSFELLSAHDQAANDAALKDGSRFLSAYVVKGERIWVMTEAVGEDGQTRTSTCILLPEDY